MRTGISIARQVHRAEMAAARESQRESARRRRELLAMQGEAERMAEGERAKYEVALYENYVGVLVSLHKEVGAAWDWAAIARAPAPPPPVFTGDPQAAAAHEAAMRRWQWFHDVARGVNAGDPMASNAVLEHLSPFEELAQLGLSVDAARSGAGFVEVAVAVKGEDILPDEERTVTVKGKLSEKKMSASKYWGLYQDYVCSASMRIAREIFALLPVPMAFVHATSLVVNPTTGHQEAQPILSVAYSRDAFLRLNLDKVDPSDALRGFVHAMKFKKTTGFGAVEALLPSTFRA
jgi:hypothetical protein